MKSRGALLKLGLLLIWAGSERTLRGRLQAVRLSLWTVWRLYLKP